MEGVIKYFAWNAMLVGTLVLSSVFKFDVMITILGWYFGIEAAIYFIAALISPAGKKELFEKNKDQFKIYKCFFEPLYVIIAFCLGHNYIAICMAVTFFGYIYLLASMKYILKNENRAASNNGFNSTPPSGAAS
jgi:hypothetical protein